MEMLDGLICNKKGPLNGKFGIIATSQLAPIYISLATVIFLPISVSWKRKFWNENALIFPRNVSWTSVYIVNHKCINANRRCCDSPLRTALQTAGTFAWKFHWNLRLCASVKLILVETRRYELNLSRWNLLFFLLLLPFVNAILQIKWFSSNIYIIIFIVSRKMCEVRFVQLINIVIICKNY